VRQQLWTTTTSCRQRQRATGRPHPHHPRSSRLGLLLPALGQESPSLQLGTRTTRRAHRQTPPTQSRLLTLATRELRRLTLQRTPPPPPCRTSQARLRGRSSRQHRSRHRRLTPPHFARPRCTAVPARREHQRQIRPRRLKLKLRHPARLRCMVVSARRERRRQPRPRRQTLKLRHPARLRCMAVPANRKRRWMKLRHPGQLQCRAPAPATRRLHAVRVRRPESTAGVFNRGMRRPWARSSAALNLRITVLTRHRQSQGLQGPAPRRCGTQPHPATVLRVNRGRAAVTAGRRFRLALRILLPWAAASLGSTLTRGAQTSGTARACRSFAT